MNQQLSKIIFFTLLFSAFFTVFEISYANTTVAAPQQDSTVTSSGGAGGTYTPISGYSGLFTGVNGFEGMLTKIFQVSILVTIMLSVIMIIWGGVEYMGSESIFKKGAGKEKIYAALSGLLIALVSVLIIATILGGYSDNGIRITIFPQ